MASRNLPTSCISSRVHNSEATALSQPAMIYRPFGAFRLFLAFLVLIQHFVANMAPEAVINTLPPYEIGGLAVLAFFCLSGFVIAEAVDCVYGHRPLAFINNRLIRIVPHFVLAVLISYAVFYMCQPSSSLRFLRGVGVSGAAFSARNLLGNAFGFLPLSDHFISRNLLEGGWAIRVEMAFYISVSIYIATKDMAGKAPIRHLDIILISLLYILFAGSLLGLVPPMLRFSPYFILGWAIYASAARPPAARPPAQGAAIYILLATSIVGIGVDFAFHSLRVTRGTDVLAEAVMLATLLAIMAVLATFGEKMSSGRRRRLDKWLGDLTYPLYLYHSSVMIAFLAFTSTYSWTSIVCATLVSLTLSCVMEQVVGAATNRVRTRIRGREIR